MMETRFVAVVMLQGLRVAVVSNVRTSVQRPRPPPSLWKRNEKHSDGYGTSRRMSRGLIFFFDVLVWGVQSP